jgi:Tfp pilus assembly protein PilX
MNTHIRINFRRGVALVLVLAAIALASVLGFAMLSSSSLQAQLSQNTTQSAAADYLAESGVQAALYYLQYPSRRPPGWDATPGYYIHAQNQSLGSAIGGTFDLTVQPTSKRDEYLIRSTGRATTSAPARSLTVRAKVKRAKITSAGHFAGNITLPTRTSVSGTIESKGTITNNTGSTLTLVADTALSPSAFEAPALGAVNFFGADTTDGKYICPDGTVGYAQEILAVPLVIPAPAANNPGQVYYYENPLLPDVNQTLPLTINGTLVVKGGSLSVRASNFIINPLAGYPALVVEKDLNMYRTNATLAANGVVWIGRNITWTQLLGANTGSKLTVKGSVLMPSGSAIAAPGTGGLNDFQFESANVDVPDISRTLQPGASVTILAWNE